MPKAGKLLKALAIGLGCLLLLAAVGTGLGYGWLQSDGGRDWLARQIEAAVRTPGETELSIGSLEGSLAETLRATDIEMHDAAGPWLTVAAIEVTWQPWKLLNRTLQIDDLSLFEVAMARPPAGATETEEPGSGSAVPSLPFKIRVGRLSADSIALGQPVLGQAARFTLVGEAGSDEAGALSAGLDLQRLDGPEARLQTKLVYNPQDDTLTTEVDAAEAPGGLIATLLETPDLPRTAMRLQGSGPLTDWNGDFSLSLGDLVDATAEISLERHGRDDLAFRLQGQSNVPPPEPDAALALIGGRTTLALEGSWQDARRLKLDRLEASNDSLDLSIGGQIDVESRALGLELGIAAQQGTALAALLGLDRLDQLSAKIALTGTLEKPQADIAFETKGIASPGFTADGATATGKLTAENDVLGEAPVLTLKLDGRLDAPRLPGQEALDPLLGRQLPWSVDATFNAKTAVLDIASLKATAEAATIAVSGQADVDEGTAQLDVALEVPELAALQPLTGIALGGAARLAGPLAVEDFGTHLAAELKGRWDRPTSDVALIAAAAGAGMDLATRLTVDGGKLSIEELTGRSDAASIDAALTLSPEIELRDTRYRIDVPDAAVLAEALGIGIAGDASLEGEVAGPFEALAVTGTAQLARMTIEEQALTGIAATYRLRIRGSEIDGPVTVSLESPVGPFKAQTELRLTDDAVTLAGLNATLPAITVTGEVALPLDTGDPVAALRAEFEDLGPLLRLADLSGAGRGTLEVGLNGEGQAAPLEVAADLSDVSLQPGEDAAPLRAAGVTVSLQAQDLALAQAASFKVAADNLRWQALDARRLNLDGSGTIQDLEFRLSGDGAWIEPFEVSAAGRVTQQDDILSVALTQAAGRLFGEAVALRDTARLTIAPTETRLTGLDLSAGEARLTADAMLADRQFALDAALDKLSLQTVEPLWDIEVDGRVSAKVKLEGPLNDPRGTASFAATELRPRGATDLPPLELTANADWRGGQVTLEGLLGGSEIAAASISAVAPFALTPEGGVAIPPEIPLSGQLDWSGDIKTLLLFVPLPQHRVNGEAAIALALSGTAETPKLNGNITLAGGRYENLETGTVLQDIDLKAAIAEDRVTLASLTANDGAGGRLTGSGGLSIDPAQQFPFDVAIQLEKLHALRRDDVTAVTSGSVEIDGTADAPRVVGRLTTETVEISLLNNLPPDVVSLDIIEVRDGVVQAIPEDEKAAPPVDAALDIVIDMPKRIFVRGRGLDSEWAGQISVQGSVADPVITGNLDLVRGQLSVVGKPFQLRAGKVTLPQSQSAEPSLDVTAVHDGEELEVTARLSGPLTEPELTLSSIPEVPRDEIISRVLFNKSAAGLTAAESAQLAIALQDLTGNGGGADILGFARRTLGVDVLRVETAEGGPALEAGKYLTDEVYVGVKQGVASQSSSAAVEVELTPNITVESEVTESGANKSGVRFKWDY